MSKYYTPTELELMKAVASGDDVYWAGNEVNQLMKDNKGIKTRISFGHLVDPSKRLSYFLAINNQEDKINYVDSSNYELKYLDHKDILDLGWDSGALQGLNEDSFTKLDYQLYWQDNQFVTIYNWDSKIIFEGILKNKYELKQLMKWLNITHQQ